jgi:polyisoprenoid-binding protein YceI
MVRQGSQNHQETTMAARQWNFDQAHSNVGFTIKHMMFAKVRGSFGEWEGSFTFDPEDLEHSKVSASIQVSSIDTGNGQRDDHLRSGDFFDTEAFPAIAFESTKWSGSGSDYTVEGNLTIRDVTKPVTLEVERTGTGTDPWGNTRTAFTASTTIDRKEFGLTWNQALEAGGVLVGEKVNVEIEVQAVEAAAEDTEAAE